MIAQDILTKINNHFQDYDNEAYDESVKLGWIDSAQQDLAKRLPASELQEITDVGISTTTVTLEEGVGSYGFQFPTEIQQDKLIRIIGIKYGKNNNRQECRIILISQREKINKSFDFAVTEKEPIAIIRSNLVELFLITAPITGDGIEVSFIKKPDVITDKSQSIQLTNFAEEIYNYCLSQGWSRDKQDEAEKYTTLYNNRIAEFWQKSLIGGKI